MIRFVLIASIVLLAPAFAQQQQPDPAFLQKAIAVLQAQRNEAQDMRANAETRILVMQDEMTKLQARIAELEKQIEPKK